MAPLFAGDTVYAWSEVLERAEIPGRRDLGVLRLRTIATKNLICAGFPLPSEARGSEAPPGDGAILDLDYWAALPRSVGVRLGTRAKVDGAALLVP